MSRGLFVTGTGTDVGKTYVTALLAKKMKEYGFETGYYKAALSGAKSIAESDAGYVNRIGGIGQEEDTLLSYLYKNALSPHLAAKIEENPVEPEVVQRDYEEVSKRYPYVLVEGSGGIICPVRYDEKKIFLEDIVKWLDIPAIIVATAGLGTINATVLTIEYMRLKKIGVRGVILNHYTEKVMEKDNAFMIEEITGIPIIAKVSKNDTDLKMEKEVLQRLFT